MIKAQAEELFFKSDWNDLPCEYCHVVLERGGCLRTSLTNPETDASIICFDCAYCQDLIEFRKTGIMRTSFASYLCIRKEYKDYKPFFEHECRMVPVWQSAWEKFKKHPHLNTNIKSGIIVNLITDKIHLLTSNQSSSDISEIRDGDLFLHVFDGMCGYVGLEVQRKNDSNGFWVQGQVREKNSRAWDRACYSDSKFSMEVADALKSHLGLPLGYEKTEYSINLPIGLFGSLQFGSSEKNAWIHAEKNVQAYLARTYNLPKSFFPSWITGSGYVPYNKKW